MDEESSQLLPTIGTSQDRAIFLTHSHHDHIGGLDRIYEVMPAPVRCHPQLVAKLQTMVEKDAVVALQPDEMVTTGGGVTLQALFTPGHEVDHVSYYLGDDRILFTGDCILGASSTTVRDLASYMRSLELMTNYAHETICPGHGPVVPPPRGAELVRWYIDHRQQREQQILAALGKGLGTVEAITRDVYPSDLPAGLRRGAGKMSPPIWKSWRRRGACRGDASRVSSATLILPWVWRLYQD